jgi:hypothetical protein
MSPAIQGFATTFIRRLTLRSRLSFIGAFLLMGAVRLFGTPSPVQAQTPMPPPQNPLPTITSATIATPTLVISSPVDAPAGFFLVDSAFGVTLLKKDYPSGNPDYVQVIDLSQGAYLKLMHGEITELRPTKGVYGGADPRMTSLAIQTYWDKALESDPNAFCVTNGEFFYMPEYPTRLAFPLKVDGTVVTDGWGIDTYVDQKLALELWSDKADIVPLTQGSLYGSTAPNLIGGLTEEANKRAKYAVGRTFVGIKDADGDGVFETLLVYNTVTALQSAAADTLRSFGAEKVMMLDGGGSTQLLCKSGWWVRSDRPIPQAMAVIAATPPQVSGKIISYSDWPVIVEGDRLPIEVRIENTGVLSWTPETTELVIQAERLEFQQNQRLDQVIEPGETAAVSQTIALLGQSGVLPVEIAIGIKHSGTIYPVKTLGFQTIVLPYKIRQRQADLQSELLDWRIENPDQVVKLANEWIDRQTGRPIPGSDIQPVQEVRPVDVTFIPLLMLPAMALIAWIIARNRH